jgi:hypothetical protein
VGSSDEIGNAYINGTEFTVSSTLINKYSSHAQPYGLPSEGAEAQENVSHFSENFSFLLLELNLTVLHGNEDLMCFLEPAAKHLF